MLIPHRPETGAKKSKNEERLGLAESAIIAGVSDVLHQVLARRNTNEEGHAGRINHGDRVLHSTLTTAVAFKADELGASLRAIAEVLDVDKKTVLAGFNRVKMMPKGPDRQRILTHAYDEHEKSCGAYPEAWAGFVIGMMDELCRASECKKDQARNPKPPHENHTVHWIEMKLESMQEIIEKAGKLKYGPEFHLSSWKLRDLKQCYHKYPGRNVCLCRYHMDWDHRCDALRRWHIAYMFTCTPHTHVAYPWKVEISCQS